MYEMAKNTEGQNTIYLHVSSLKNNILVDTMIVKQKNTWDFPRLKNVHL